jgi:hypothetical protein
LFLLTSDEFWPRSQADAPNTQAVVSSKELVEDGDHRKTIRKKRSSLFRPTPPSYAESDGESYSDLEGDFNVDKFKDAISNRLSQQRPLAIADKADHLTSPPKDEAPVRVDLKQYVDNNSDDFSKDFEQTSLMPFGALSKIRSGTILSSDESDPFSGIDDTFSSYDATDLASTVARDRIARANSDLETIVNSLLPELTSSELEKLTWRMLSTLKEFPDSRKTIIRTHGLIPILNVLQRSPSKTVVANLINCLISIGTLDDCQSLETFCLVGGLPVLIRYASKRNPPDLRHRTALFIALICQSGTTGCARFFTSCGGLDVLGDFLTGDDGSEKDFISIGVQSLWGLLENHTSSSRSDICRALCRGNVLESLAGALTTMPNNELCDMVISILGIFSQADSYVKRMIGRRTVFRSLLRRYGKLTESNQIRVLKFIKSMSIVEPNLKVLQDSNAIEKLVTIVYQSKQTPRYKEVVNQILPIMSNMCRLSAERQTQAASAGLIPVLQDVARQGWPIKEFALPILCDMAYAGLTCRNALWTNDVLSTFLFMVADPYWQVNAYKALLAWLREDLSRLEDRLVQPIAMDQLLSGLDEAKNNNFNAVIQSLLAILKLSPLICRRLPLQKLYGHIKRGLKDSNPEIVLNLLRLLRAVVDSNENGGRNLKKERLIPVLQQLTTSEAVLVKKLAGELLAL